jgi:hypothetical protein
MVLQEQVQGLLQAHCTDCPVPQEPVQGLQQQQQQQQQQQAPLSNNPVQVMMQVPCRECCHQALQLGGQVSHPRP